MPKLNLLYVAFCCCAVMYACHNNAPKKQPIVKHAVSLSIEQDTIAQAVQFDSSQSVKSNLLQGWIDYFTIDGRQFRVRYDSTEDSMRIECHVGNQWAGNTTLVIRDQFETTFDCNYDGYSDLYSQYGNQNYINYYLPGKKLFSEQYRQPGDSESLLDSANGIYINLSEPYHSCNNYVSQLLDYRKTVPNVHFFLTGETYRVDDECIIDSIRQLYLYRYDAVKDSAILLKSFAPKSPKEFGYEEFWKDNYKELMGIK